MSQSHHRESSPAVAFVWCVVSSLLVGGMGAWLLVQALSR